MIDEAEKAGLLNIGGQLQFLMPEGTCECYWVEVDALTGEPEGLIWTQRVALAATAARQKMADISRRYDFIDEGRRAFTAPFALTKLPAVMFATACASSGTYRLTRPN